MAAQGLDRKRRQLHDAAAALRLRLTAQGLGVGDPEQITRALSESYRVGGDGEASGVEVDVPPAQRKQLTLAQPRGEH